MVGDTKAASSANAQQITFASTYTSSEVTRPLRQRGVLFHDPVTACSPPKRVERPSGAVPEANRSEKGRGITCVTCATEATGAECICCRAWLLLSAPNSASVFGRGSPTRNPSFRAGVFTFRTEVLASVMTGGFLCMDPVIRLWEFENLDLLRGFRAHLHWCERGDSNPHGFTRQILSLVRLPIPPLSQLHQ